MTLNFIKYKPPETHYVAEDGLDALVLCFCLQLLGLQVCTTPDLRKLLFPSRQGFFM